jgi:prepilin-type N-terminal cleavage/methylation domain-containing protein
VTRRAFTLIELLVAIVLLLAVLIATSKVFNTASKVASTGESNADVLQQATVLEEQLRRDLGRICRDGFFAIHCVEVPNNVHRLTGGAGAPLVNPAAPENATVRCDQIVFFTAGSEISMRWAGPGDLAAAGGGQQARAAMVRYAHGVQLPGLTEELLKAFPSSGQPDPVPHPIATRALGGAISQFVPWWWSGNASRSVEYRSGTTAPRAASLAACDPNQPEARQWTLARKAVLLADDGSYPNFYPEPANYAVAELTGPSSAPSVFGDLQNAAATPQPQGSAYRRWHWREFRDRGWIPLSADIIPSPLIQCGWVDIAASDLDKVRRAIAPTLRLSTPVQFGPGASLASISTPFGSRFGEAPGPGFGSDDEPPLGWPRPQGGCSGDGCWPADTGVVLAGGNLSGSPAGSTTPPAVRQFTTQRDRIMRGVFGVGSAAEVPQGNTYGFMGWPRAEKSIVDLDRKTELLTSATLLTNCSSFRVEWTWEQGTGRQVDSSGTLIGTQIRTDAFGNNRPVPVIEGLGQRQDIAGNLWVLRGFEPFANPTVSWPASFQDPPSRARDQPWFGLPNPSFGVTLAQDASVTPQCLHQADPPAGGGAAFSYEVSNKHMRRVAELIEGLDGPDGGFPGEPRAVTRPFAAYPGVRAYSAVFGFNQDDAYVVTPDGIVVLRDDYTPWPTQVRVTVTLHDPRLVLDRGREFQFVIDVPKRRKD